VAAQAIDWLGLLRVVPLDAALVKAAVKTSRSAQLSYWDGLIVASAEAGGCKRLLTEDLNDGQQIGSVRVENPFA
jgi:predicted nucleic acid-binding protein